MHRGTLHLMAGIDESMGDVGRHDLQATDRVEVKACEKNLHGVFTLFIPTPN